MKKFIGIILLAIVFAVVLFAAQVYAADNNNSNNNNNSTEFALQKKLVRLEWRLDIKIAHGQDAINAINDYNSSINMDVLRNDVLNLQNIKLEVLGVTTQAGFVIEKHKANAAIKQLNRDIITYVPKAIMKQVRSEFMTHKKQIMQSGKDKFNQLKEMHKQGIANTWGQKDRWS